MERVLRSQNRLFRSLGVILRDGAARRVRNKTCKKVEKTDKSTALPRRSIILSSASACPGMFWNEPIQKKMSNQASRQYLFWIFCRHQKPTFPNKLHSSGNISRRSLFSYRLGGNPRYLGSKPSKALHRAAVFFFGRGGLNFALVVPIEAVPFESHVVLSVTIPPPEERNCKASVLLPLGDGRRYPMV